MRGTFKLLHYFRQAKNLSNVPRFPDAQGLSESRSRGEPFGSHSLLSPVAAISLSFHSTGVPHG
ncbi:hypothetical protein GRI39_02095 [Altererythrobacter indicus]|uniref:Uncharacterized protein n=1 Tax=Altericroceibacterium indicum TaxID=374177 RepID=A0A845ACD3_9SPHN|nr:hypothetical protein [Altericroceibacterium indicum]MXP24838.1 hypothetical protein [Altericroceibacterium indicum]